MLADAHIHFGQFYDSYTSPTELKQFLNSVGVKRFAASSTTICEGDYDKVISEIMELILICEDRFFPVLWIVPPMLEDGGLDKFLNTGITWRCLKIHPQLHPEAWLYDSLEMKSVIKLASCLQIPLLIHTGEMPGCYPKLYERWIADCPNVTFILAHGRPVRETMELMKQYPNVWVDTAFMPIEIIRQLCNENLSDRVCWGSDYPILRYYYPNKNIKNYYCCQVQRLRNSINLVDYGKITGSNFKKLFV